MVASAPQLLNNFLNPDSAVMNTARSGATATLLPNGKVLIAGGMDPFENVLASTDLYDSASNAFLASDPAAMNKIGRAHV